MNLVIYADFNCPYSCLANSRVDALVERGLAEVEWRSVEHDCGIAKPSEPVEGRLAVMLDREIGEVRALLRPGEPFPIRRPPVRPNTARAVALFAAADRARAHRLRRRLFAALWFQGLDLGDPVVLRDLTGEAPEEATVPLAEAWRAAWRTLERPQVPMLVLPGGYVSRGLGALARLADLAAAPDRGRSRSPARAV